MNSEVDFTVGFSCWIVATGTPDFVEMRGQNSRWAAGGSIVGARYRFNGMCRKISTARVEMAPVYNRVGLPPASLTARWLPL